MPDKEDLTGQHFGAWEVLSLDIPKGPPRWYSRSWVCRCRCGTVRVIRSDELKRGKTSECKGCYDAKAAERAVMRAQEFARWRVMHGEPGWTEDMLQRLRALWDEGVPTAEIGRRLGVSKNAVVGKSHRIGLTPRGSPIKKGTGTPSLRNRARVRTYRGERTPAPLASVNVSQQDNAISAEAAVIRTIRSLPGWTRPAAPASLQPRADRTVPEPVKYARIVPCCYPIGEVKSRDFRFCEKPSEPGKPYCADCCKRAYVIRNRAA